MKLLLSLFLAFSFQVHAAITSSAVWEVRSTASANNVGGGCFKTGATGTDFSQQDAPQYALTTSTTSAANAIVLDASAAAVMVGNCYHLISGTNATPGWYEITAVSVGVSFTVDRNLTTAAGASMVGNIGGAISLNSSTANQTDTNWAAALTAGNTVWIKNGSYTFAAAPTFTGGTNNTTRILVSGYNSSRGDNPIGANRPSINAGAFVITTGNWHGWSNLILTGTAASVITTAAGGRMINMKVTNTSTTAARNAMAFTDDAGVAYNNELISYRGRGLSWSNGTGQFDSGIFHGNYIHDSNIGINLANNSGATITSNIIEGCVTQAINVGGSSSSSSYLISNNTLYGAENKLGTGIAIGSGVATTMLSNIIYGFATGVNDAGTAGKNIADYNATNNNTTNYTNVTAGANDVTTAPSFTSATQITGTAGSISGSVLTDGTKNFSGIVNGVDFLYIVSGTGATAGIYGVASHTTTTLTLDIAPGGSGSNIVYQITSGHNFALGTNYKAKGFPGAMPGALSTGYMDPGAIQRQEPAGGSSTYSRSRVINQ